MLGDSKDKAFKTLQSLPMIDQSTLSDQKSQIVFAGGIIAVDEHEKVKSISYNLRYQLTVEELISIKGQPDGFTYDRQMDPAQPILINLVWPTQGLQVEIVSEVSFTGASKDSPVTPDSLIAFAAYFEPVASAEEYLLRFAGPTDYPDVSVLKFHNYYEWQGYTPLPHY